ncbi:hypothetical protein ATE49_19315 [Elizabethkingia miricola]|uniref:Lipoprotein n=2 Tax=Weeksellaceae TaxID=2762318 RepID=A0ABY3NHD7_ELIMR|nr:hypothetical protein [Elizabethkingia miricola]MCT3755598.1 hypothetical protein [Elizabethkingia anophelis]MCT4046403.1 hypothetical protein [Elizabethkingia anophelis]MDV3780601.1 hypothetical protein [Elizabethkingia anophelis]MDV3790867.1 hypothetical protein [Elizabethkingia anophelis]MDV3811621.1 hypothetical protein [Elizabethkingia anophelis]
MFISSCNKHKESSINEQDIVKILYIDVGCTTDIIDNTYTLNEMYKEPGVHNLMLTSSEINTIKKNIIELKIYELEDSLKFVKNDKDVRLAEFWIYYKSSRKQHFVYDSSEDNYKNKSFQKIMSLKGIITNIMKRKKIDPETKNAYL